MAQQTELTLETMRAVGAIPSGVFIVTAGQDDAALGTMISLVQQVSIEPLCVGMAIKKGRAMADVLEPGARYVINICHAHDKTLLRKYAQASQSGLDVYEGIRTRRLPSGQTVLLDACAYVECELIKVLEFGADHDWFVGVVKGGEVLAEGKVEPMIHVRRDGAKY